MILQKSFFYADLLLKKHFLLSILKTVVLLLCGNISGYFDEQSPKE